MGKDGFMNKEEYLKFLDGLPYDQPDSSKREDKCFVIKGSNECIALDATPSEECKEYHKNSCIQINHNDNSYLMRYSEQSGN